MVAIPTVAVRSLRALPRDDGLGGEKMAIFCPGVLVGFS